MKKYLSIAEAIKETTKYWRNVVRSSVPRGLYVGGLPYSKNLGDRTLYLAYQRLFSEINLITYRGGRLLSLTNRAIRPVKVGVLGGGTLFNWGNGPLRSMNDCSVFLDKLIVFGNGVRNPSFWDSVHWWKDNLHEWKPLLKKCCYVGVRGPLSAKLMMDAGIDNVEVIGDPVISLAANRPTPYVKSGQRDVGLNICLSDGLIWGSEERVVNEFIKLANELRRDGVRVHWFVVCPADLDITTRCAVASETDDHVNSFIDYSRYMDSVGKMDVFIGMRLHSVVLSTCQYVPSIMIEYRPKCLDYMQSIDQEVNNVRSDGFDVNKVMEQVRLVLKTRSDVVEHLDHSIGRIKQKQLRVVQAIQKDIMV